MTLGQVLYGFFVPTFNSCDFTVKLLTEELVKLLLFVSHGLLVRSEISFSFTTDSLDLFITSLELRLELVFLFIQISQFVFKSIDFDTRFI